MSYEAWGDGDYDDNRFTEDQVAKIATKGFILGLQFCREMNARFVEQGGDCTTAASIRANWNPTFGDDPGAILDADYDKMRNSFDYGVCIE